MAPSKTRNKPNPLALTLVPTGKFEYCDGSAWYALASEAYVDSKIGPSANLTLTGDITGSGSLNNPVATIFKSNPVFTGSESMTIPVGTTAQRPASPTVGMMRLNNDLSLFPVFWLDASNAASITLSGSNVTSWNNLGSAGGSVAQTNASYYPVLVTNALNGKNMVSFNGTNQHLFKQVISSLYPLGNSARTIFAVISNATVMNYAFEHVFHYGTAATNRAYGFLTRSSSASFFGNHYWGNAFVSSLATNTNAAVFQTVLNGTIDTFYRNGTSIGTKTVTLDTGTDWLCVGARVSPAEFGKFYLAELRLYNTALSSSESATITSELMSKWGIV